MTGWSMKSPISAKCSISGELAVHFLAGKAEDGAIQVDIVASAEFGIESGAELEKGGYASMDRCIPLCNLKDTGDDLQQGTFAGAVFPYDTEGLAAMDFE